MKVERTNTILYCSRWSATVDFYRDVIGLEVVSERHWFVEFRIGPRSFVSVADAAHATIASAHGAGVTLSWQVDDVDLERARLTSHGVRCSPVTRRWGGDCTFLTDPEGTRIELWTIAETRDEGSP